eukprot:scaffold49051_cov20-Cyclotella_meneghiniana.AAC.1
MFAGKFVLRPLSVRLNLMVLFKSRSTVRPSHATNMSSEHCRTGPATCTNGAKKTGDRGVVTMFVGYSGRESDSYRLWNPETNRVIVTRDVTFLGRMFYLQPENSEWQVIEDVGTPAKVELGDLEGATGDEDGEDAADEEAIDDDANDDDATSVKSITWADEVEAQEEQVESEAGGNATVVAPVTTRSGRT